MSHFPSRCYIPVYSTTLTQTSLHTYLYTAVTVCNALDASKLGIPWYLYVLFSPYVHVPIDTDCLWLPTVCLFVDGGCQCACNVTQPTTHTISLPISFSLFSQSFINDWLILFDCEKSKYIDIIYYDLDI